MGTGRLGLGDAFVDGGRMDDVGNDADLRQQRLAPRAFAGQDQDGLSGSDR